MIMIIYDYCVWNYYGQTPQFARADAVLLLDDYYICF